ncbi:NAD-dependent epimerase/dehydratase family protein [Microbacterium sp. NPDC056052]|uniref:NAD-dependent epimerase/dehydratase family protein n=1 Tax=Microbacterium sp. NPDC056052 TaxID=3345695 RepID=UPI0035D97C8A
MSVHVVLGARGVIGQETIAALTAGGDDVIAVARGPVVVPEGVRTRQADLLDAAQTRTAVAGADVVHLVAGLRYDHAVWAREWPVIVRNAAVAARDAGARLVALDNVYAYGRVEGPMREDTPLRPISRKGRVRAEAREMLLSFPDVAVGVAADFYGPGARTSVFNRLVIDALRRGRAGRWLFDAGLAHSMTYTPDIGSGLAALGRSTETGVWHLPTSAALRGIDYIDIAAGEPGRARVLTRGQLRLAALVDREARETLEMGYQYEHPYLFDSSAFERRFGIAPTPFAVGVRRAIEAERPRLGA